MIDSKPITAVAPEPLKATLPSVTAKYGDVAIGGFQPVPDLLLKNQAALELTATDMVVLLNVLMYWWYPAQKPYPRPTTIAKRMGVTTRTVQRSLQNLEELDLVKRKQDEKGISVLDPTPLVSALQKLAPNDPDYLVRKERQNTA